MLSTPPPEVQSFSISARARSCFAAAERSCAYTKMLVSTKALSAMKFVTGTRERPAEIESFAQARYRAFSRAVVPLALAHDSTELCR